MEGSDREAESRVKRHVAEEGADREAESRLKRLAPPSASSMRQRRRQIENAGLRLERNRPWDLFLFKSRKTAKVHL